MEPVTIGLIVSGVCGVVTTIVIWRTKRTMLRESLEGVPPGERAKIIRSMRGLFKSDYQIGPLKRQAPAVESAEGSEKDAGES